MTAKPGKWKSLLAATESDVTRRAHQQDDAAQSATLTTWTAWGNVDKDPLTPLIGRPIGASLKKVGAKKIVATGLSAFELSGAPNLQTLDLRECEETLDAKRIAALRKAFPRAKVLPK